MISSLFQHSKYGGFAVEMIETAGKKFFELTLNLDLI